MQAEEGMLTSLKEEASSALFDVLSDSCEDIGGAQDLLISTFRQEFVQRTFQRVSSE